MGNGESASPARDNGTEALPEGSAVMHAGPGAAIAAGLPTTILIGSHLWPRWTRIAIDHQAAAWQARRQAEADYAGYRGGARSDPADALGRELDSALQAVSAAGHALDCFYGAVKGYEVVPPEVQRAWSSGRTKRPNQILETLKLGFSVGKIAQRWGDDFAWLFGLRDGAVHYEEEAKVPQLHPLGCETAPENVAYSAENAERAVNLVFEVLETCFAHPKARNRALEGYLAGMRDELERLRQRRDGTGASLALALVATAPNKGR